MKNFRFSNLFDNFLRRGMSPYSREKLPITLADPALEALQIIQTRAVPASEQPLQFWLDISAYFCIDRFPLEANEKPIWCLSCLSKRMM